MRGTRRHQALSRTFECSGVPRMAHSLDAQPLSDINQAAVWPAAAVGPLVELVDHRFLPLRPFRFRVSQYEPLSRAELL